MAAESIEEMGAGATIAGGTEPRTYPGLQWCPAVDLPQRTQAWPRFAAARTAAAVGHEYDVSREEIRAYAAGRMWVWPGRTVHFLSDQHADADALFASLVASGGIVKTGPDDSDFRLSDQGREGLFVIGGDCLDKGPSNLRLLRALGLLLDSGAEVELLAGNHDLRALVGFAYMGRKEPRLAHLFVRLGRKSLTLFREVHQHYLAGRKGRATELSDAAVREICFPGEDWYEEFPRAVAGLIPEPKLAKEVRRIREKVADIEKTCRETGMSLGALHAAAEKSRELFCEPDGEFHWFYGRMKLALKLGSFLFIHAGVDDTTAAEIRTSGVDGLNERFRQLLNEDLFELYHGPFGSAFRTKYRDIDFPFTEAGVADMHAAGIYGIVHGHKSISHGQRVLLHNGLLNFECDASVDSGTRHLVGLRGRGGAATVLFPDGTVHGVSTDHPYVKVFDSRSLIEFTTIV